ncbi:uncharacterized protein [Mytilus edulis]|uniref:uncharacterized protein n=1 Tax=Mytilus edulis TaxID=6550 RepID=UPI0039EF342F
MNISVWLFVSLLLVYSEVNMANDEMQDGNRFLEKLVKRSVGVGVHRGCIGRPCSFTNSCCHKHRCSNGYCDIIHGK